MKSFSFAIGLCDPQSLAALHRSQIDGPANRASVEQLLDQSSAILSTKVPAIDFKNITNQMRSKVDAWIDQAKNLKPSDPSRVAVLEKHKVHLQGLERNLDLAADRLRAEGFDVERIRAAIWTHDIGKFVAPSQQTIERHSLAMLFVPSAEGKERALNVMMKNGVSKTDAEKFLSVGYTIGPTQTSLTDALDKLSASVPNLREILKDSAIRNPFAEFMDHAETSRSFMINESSGSALAYRQLALDSIGHDGPPAQGSFWGDFYKKVTGRDYPTPQTREGLVLQALDRLDQTELNLGPNGLTGGPAKIAQERILRGDTVRKALEETALGSVPNGTGVQAQALKVVNGIEGASPVQGVTRSPLANGFVPAGLDRQIVSQVKNLKDLKAATVFFDASDATGNIGYVLVDGIKVLFKDMDSFFGEKGAATQWWKQSLKDSVKK